ncbi:MAG: putative cell wall binding repeat 2-containing protein [Acidimicrobiales bacterium]|jgi:putative cell wall-binding protein|nr:putative cell wall binding repeat 2-containing protein [Acidimicrobiales bacterium]
MSSATFRAGAIACVMTFGALATGVPAAHAATRTSLFTRAAQFGRMNYSGVTGDSITDPNDVSGTLDIATATRSGDATSVTILVTTYDAFTDQDALFLVPIDINGDNVIDHEVIAGWDGTALIGEVSHGTPHTQLATVTRPDSTSISITFPRALIDGSTTFAWAVGSLAFVPPSTIVFDSAPDTASFAPGPPATRVAGTDRIGTAIESSFFSPATAKAVVVARSDDYADALAGAPLAVARQAPMLLNPTAALDPRVQAEIERALPKGGTVFLLGGLSALSQSVQDAIAGDGYNVIRYQGADRFATALTIASAGLGDPSTLFLTTGTNFADALPAGPAAAEKNGAILLTNGTTMPASVQAYIAAHSGATRFAIGGPAAAADPAATPVVGTDRYDTAKRVAATFFTSPADVGLASGVAFPDALGGGTAVAELGGPLLLTDPAALSPAAQSYLSTNKAGIGTVWIFGGLSAVGLAVEQAVNSTLA